MGRRRARADRSHICFAVLTLVLAAAVPPAFGIDCDREIDPINWETDVRSLIHAVTPADVERIRGELIEYIWKAPMLPTALPEVETGVANPFPELAQLTDLKRIDRLTVAVDGFVSRMFLFIPTDARRRLVIFHQGHTDSVAGANGAETVTFLLAHRYPVLIVHMPLYGLNSAPVARGFTFHDRMFDRETPTLSPFKYFLEPIVQAVNYAERVLRVWRLYMVGISGGGWTTVLAAAVDPRIDVSFPVAGSLPLYLRRPEDPCLKPGDHGDREQYHPGLYGIADYLDLYILGSYGRGRGQLQVVNQFDDCCFGGLRYLTYRDIVQNVVAGLQRGSYNVFLDSSHRSHLISRHTLEDAIYPVLRHGRFPEGSEGPRVRGFKGARVRGPGR